MIPVPSGSYAMVGYTDSYGGGGMDFWLLRLDENCDSLWSVVSGTARHEFGSGVIETVDGGFAVCGYVMTAEGDYDFTLLKINDVPQRPEISVAPSFIDFGEVEFRRSSPPLELTVANIDDAELEVTAMEISDDQFEIDFDGPYTLPAGAERIFHLTLTPWDTVFVEADLLIYSNDEANSPFRVCPQGTGVWVPVRDQLEGLCAMVTALRDEGVLNRGQANSLCSKVSSAIRALDRRQANVVGNLLGAFVNHTQDYINEGVLSADQGAPLIAEAIFILS